MQSFSDRCIFCFEELSDSDRKGKGEHIIPEFLGGSFCIKVVCKSCNNRLGATVDHLALEDERIISAAFALDLPELQAKILDRGGGKMIDATDGSETPVRFKAGKPRTVPRQVSEDLFVSDERDAFVHLVNSLKKDTRHGLDEHEIVRIVEEELKPKYDRLKPGESVREQRLGVRLRKAPGEIHPTWKTTERACERLVAKIGYETAFLTFDRDRLLSVPALRGLAAVAMGEGDLSDAVLMYPLDPYSPVNEPPQRPRYHHQIVVRFDDFGNVIDIYFFGCVGFRLFLRGDCPEAHGPQKGPNGDLEMVSLLMSFEPSQNKRKRFFLRRVGSDEVEQGELTGLA